MGSQFTDVYVIFEIVYGFSIFFHTIYVYYDFTAVYYNCVSNAYIMFIKALTLIVTAAA